MVSRHLTARADRRADLLAVQRPWDAVLVDEAHAARRRVFGGRDEPNQLLGLLQTLRARSLLRCLWLLTATPMQLDPHEVHDLLLLCGLDAQAWGRWSNLAAFQGFFEGLRHFPRDRQVRADVLAMTRVAVARGAPELDATQVPPHWRQLQWGAALLEHYVYVISPVADESLSPDVVQVMSVSVRWPWRSGLHDAA